MGEKLKKLNGFFLEKVILFFREKKLMNVENEHMETNSMDLDISETLSQLALSEGKLYVAILKKHKFKLFFFVDLFFLFRLR